MPGADSARWFVRLFVATVVVAGAGQTDPLAFTAEVMPSGIRLARDESAGTTTIVIPAPDGRLDWNDVLRGLARVAGLDDSALDDEPAAPIDLNHISSRMTIVALGAAVPDLSVRIIHDAVTSGPALSIRLDRDNARARFRTVKGFIRTRFGEDANYGLEFDGGWDQRPADRPLVVLVHGYNAGPRSMNRLRLELVERGWPCATFRYANDGPIDESAALLARELAQFRQAHPARKVAIVGYSMGGLVARAAIEDPERDPGNVARLVMVCTPNQGSRWAELPCGLDCWEHSGSAGESAAAGMFEVSVADGLNESQEDLKPGSKFLRELNARERNRNVRYSQILGTAGPLTGEAVEAWRTRIDSSLSGSRAGKLLRPRVEAFFDGLDEPVAGKGDGAVSVERGRLVGVEDTLLLPINHWTLKRPLDEPPGDELRDAILSRLAE